MRRRRVLLSVLVLVVALGSSALALWRWMRVELPAYVPDPSIALSAPFRTWAEHDAIYPQSTFPRVFRSSGAKREVLYIGAKHSSDAADPQHDEIERLWREFRPTVALCEGRGAQFRFDRRPTTGGFTEPRLVGVLARRSGVPLYSIEPAYADEVRALIAMFPPRRVAAFFTLRVFAQENTGGETDALALRLLRKRTDVDGLRGTLRTIADLDQLWRDEFADQPDWRTLRQIDGIPNFGAIAHASREVRGKHMARCLIDLARRGERVFAVVGASHVIRHEPTLEAALNPTN